MSKKIKFGPDWLQTRIAIGLHWLQENMSAVLLVVVPVVVVGFGAFGWHYAKVYLSSERRADLAQIDGMLQDALEVAEKQRQTIQEKIDSAGIKDKDKSKDKEKSGESAEVKALTDELEAIKPNYMSAIKGYEDYFMANKSSVEGWRAAVEASILLTQDRTPEDLKKAAGLLTEVLKNSGEHRVYGLQARMMLISLLEELKEYKDALLHVDESLKVAEKDIRANVLMVKARILRGMGQNDDAKEVLNEVISQHAEAPEAQKARAVLAL